MTAICANLMHALVVAGGGFEGKDCRDGRGNAECLDDGRENFVVIVSPSRHKKGRVEATFDHLKAYAGPTLSPVVPPEL